MAGEARTSTFMLATATVMLGAPADLLNFAPDTHSIGLAKNVMADQQTGEVELTQGQFNTVVDSKKNSAKNAVKFEMYEYTSRNLAYALGLDGATFSKQTTQTTIPAAVVPGAGGVSSITVASATGFSVGNYILISEASGNNPEEDKIITRQITGIVGNVITVDVAIKVAFLAGAVVRKSNIMGVGQKKDDAILAMAISGTLSDNTPVLMCYPKVRISKGFSANFQTQQYGNMPIEISVLDSTQQDPHYARLQAQGSASAFLLTTG